MGPRIPDPIRKRVAQQWIEGISRDKIAKENQVGTGTVNRIIRNTMVNQWETRRKNNEFYLN